MKEEEEKEEGGKGLLLCLVRYLSTYTYASQVLSMLPYAFMYMCFAGRKIMTINNLGQSRGSACERLELEPSLPGAR